MQTQTRRAHEHTYSGAKFVDSCLMERRSFSPNHAVTAKGAAAEAALGTGIGAIGDNNTSLRWQMALMSCAAPSPRIACEPAVPSVLTCCLVPIAGWSYRDCYRRATLLQNAASNNDDNYSRGQLESSRLPHAIAPAAEAKRQPAARRRPGLAMREAIQAAATTTTRTPTTWIMSKK